MIIPVNTSSIRKKKFFLKNQGSSQEGLCSPSNWLHCVRAFVEPSHKMKVQWAEHIPVTSVLKKGNRMDTAFCFS